MRVKLALLAIAAVLVFNDSFWQALLKMLHICIGHGFPCMWNN